MATTKKTQVSPIYGLHDLKERGGFWVPNEFVDLYADLIGSKGIHLYILLVRSCTLKDYPSVAFLAEKVRLTQPRVRALLDLLFRYEILNAHDMDAILTQEDV